MMPVLRPHWHCQRSPQSRAQPMGRLPQVSTSAADSSRSSWPLQHCILPALTLGQARNKYDNQGSTPVIASKGSTDPGRLSPRHCWDASIAWPHWPQEALRRPLGFDHTSSGSNLQGNPSVFLRKAGLTGLPGLRVQPMPASGIGSEASRPGQSCLHSSAADGLPFCTTQNTTHTEAVAHPRPAFSVDSLVRTAPLSG